jgi:hypothetical protein
LRVCVYVCLSVYTCCVYTCVVCKCICIHVSVCLSGHMNVWLCECEYICTRVYLCGHVSMYVCVSGCVAGCKSLFSCSPMLIL